MGARNRRADTALIACRFLEGFLLLSFAFCFPELALKLGAKVLAPSPAATGCGELIFFDACHKKPSPKLTFCSFLSINHL
jgi:hypothetical protein